MRVSSSTSGIKLDPSTRKRIKQAAASLDRTPHWFMKKAVLYWLRCVEDGSSASDLLNEVCIGADNSQSVDRSR
ncbi:transcriptional regulator [Pseudomonas sp. ABY48]|uniref:transcriptional regulator n=1 Tax=Pseudomonas sp. ABY48 TaxID=3402865 RepID=UPI003B42DD87